MMIQILFFCLVFFIPNIFAITLDKKLELVQKVYNLKPKNCNDDSKKHRKYEELKAGEALFSSVSLSGNRDTSCTKCHIDRFGTADGLPLSVGVGGVGEGKIRYKNGLGAIVPRNAFSLRGRSHPEFKAFFWDGKAQLDKDRIITQFGKKIDGKFDSLLAAAAILPLIERDEFLGKK